MLRFPLSPFEIPRSLSRNAALVWVLVKRDIMGRYRGSILGIFWSFINPILMIGIYTFVFSTIMKAKWTPSSESRGEFATILFAGLIIFNFFSECINRAPNLILANQNYVKKLIFPLEILPWVSLGTAFFHATVSLIAWIIFYVVLLGWPPLGAFYLPLTTLPLIMLTLGASWFLASLGVYFRDISQIISLLTTALMFLSPVFYPLDSVPPTLRPLLLWNPLTPSIEMSRGALMWGQVPDWTQLLISIFFSGVVMAAGFSWFQKTRKGFADVL